MNVPMKSLEPLFKNEIIFLVRTFKIDKKTFDVAKIANSES